MRIYNMCGSSIRNGYLEFGIFKGNCDTGTILWNIGIGARPTMTKGIKAFGPFWWSKRY
jgi:hypothetical protein